MEEPFNSASRVLAIIERARRTHSNTLIINAWSEVFRVTTADRIDRYVEITQSLQMLRDEIAYLRSIVATKVAVQRKVGEALVQIQNVIAPDNFNRAWGDMAGHMPETLEVALSFLVHDLASEPARLPDEEIETLEAQLKEAQRLVLEGSLSDDVRRVFLQQIRFLLTALRAYRIRGIVAFRQLVFELKVAYSEDQEAFERAVQDEEGRQAWEIIKRVGGRIIYILSAIDAVHSLGGAVIKTFLGPGETPPPS
jgi:hypothetical protein